MVALLLCDIGQWPANTTAPSPLHAKPAVPHHLIRGAEERKPDGYCDLAHLPQNVSNSPQGSAGTKQNRCRPAEHLRTRSEESRDSRARTDACSKLLFLTPSIRLTAEHHARLLFLQSAETVILKMKCLKCKTLTSTQTQLTGKK